MENSLPKFAIIVAGGTGSRMKSALPKQFLLLKGKPVLMHTLEKFREAEPAATIFLALPAEQVLLWKELCDQYNFTIVHHVVAGGSTRFGSVLNALKMVPAGKGLVAVHDGVRPLVTSEIIRESFTEAEKYGSAVAAVAVKDSVRKISGFESEAIDRSMLRLVQTPQTFLLSVLREAFYSATNNQFTDDASVVEAAGHKIHLISGSYSNIKITTPEDLVLAEALLENERK